MLMPVTQAMIEAALSKIREADYDVPYAVVSVALEAAERASKDMRTGAVACTSCGGSGVEPESNK